MREFTFEINLNDSPIKLFKNVYEIFLGYEHTTHHKELWLQQKKIYEEIINSDNPEKALEEFKKLNITTTEAARRRLKH